MPRPSVTCRIQAAVAAAATVAVLAVVVVPGVAAAAGSAPLIDGWRAAPSLVVVRTSALMVTGSAGGGAARARLVRPPGVAGSPAPCEDRARRFTRGQWQDTYRWSFRARSTPPNLAKRATANALRRGVLNITNANNDCGRSDRIAATAEFLGVTDRRPAPTYARTCAERDDHNVIGFGRLPSDIAALTCVWSIGDRIIEADIKLNRGMSWATSLATCDVESLVEAVATHESGHVFGMGHVKESTHGRLTMSERLDGYCQNGESTLGLGDLLGLESIY